MATTEIHHGGGSSAAPWIAFLVGVVLVGAIVAVFVLSGGGLQAPTKQVNVDINPPKLPEINVPEAPRVPQVVLPEAPTLPSG